MGKHRLEAFSDGVIAILIAIMVLGLSVAHGTDISRRAPLLPVLMSYVLSFVFLSIPLSFVNTLVSYVVLVAILCDTGLRGIKPPGLSRQVASCETI